MHRLRMRADAQVKSCDWFDFADISNADDECRARREALMFCNDVPLDVLRRLTTQARRRSQRPVLSLAQD